MIGIKMREVIQVIPRKDFKVYVYFDNGKIKLFDMSHLLGVGIFKQISDIEVFTKTCTVMNHTLAFDILGNRDPYHCLDIDPVNIYEQGIDVDDPNTIAKS